MTEHIVDAQASPAPTPATLAARDAAANLDKALYQLRGLANCVAVLGWADRVQSEQPREELIDQAFPALGWIMGDIVNSAESAAKALTAAADPQ